jgi:hypothetical protein
MICRISLRKNPADESGPKRLWLLQEDIARLRRLWKEGKGSGAPARLEAAALKRAARRRPKKARATSGRAERK